MMGPTQSRDPKLFHYGVNLEKRVRANNPLRQIKETVDFSFVRPAVVGFYGQDGHESEDPIVIVKLMLLLFLDDVSGERELMRIVAERLDYLWFLEMDLDDEIPNHSVLSKARKRWGKEVFQDLFVRVVEACVEAGLVRGDKIHMDGSVINANASMKSLRSGCPELMEQLRAAYCREEAKLETNPESDENGGAEATRRHRTVSKTDPDAVLMRKGADAARPRYKNHRAVDDEYGVITAVETTPADINENEKLLDLVEQHEANTGEKVRTVVADAQYGTNDNFAACQQRGIQSHMADLRATYTNDAPTRGIFRETDFQYDADTDTYLCPAGQRLKRGKNPTENTYLYRGSKKICNNCPLRSQCMRSKHWRTIRRHIHHDLVQQARRESHSGRARRDRRRRKHLMEGSFADATCHGFKRARWRRLQNQQIQDYLIAVCQNIRILINSDRQRNAAAMVVGASAALIDLSGPFSHQSAPRRKRPHPPNPRSSQILRNRSTSSERRVHELLTI
jgi:transposase